MTDKEPERKVVCVGHIGPRALTSPHLREVKVAVVKDEQILGYTAILDAEFFDKKDLKMITSFVLDETFDHIINYKETPQ